MPEQNISRTVPNTGAKAFRLVRVFVQDGYQPSRALTSEPPKGRTGVPSPEPEKTASSSSKKFDS
jgi:hypothetical protein